MQPIALETRREWENERNCGRRRRTRTSRFTRHGDARFSESKVTALARPSQYNHLDAFPEEALLLLALTPKSGSWL
jgi:hypothetical protein